MANAADKLKLEKEKSYKTSHDPQRVHHLLAALHYMRDYPASSAIASSFGREIKAMNLKQEEMDTEDKAAEERAKPTPAPAPEPEEEEKSNPTHPRTRHR